MRMLALFLCCCLFAGQSVVAQNYSVDVGQPDTLGGFPPADDILAPGFPPAPVLVGGVPGLNVDAFSFNAFGPTPIDGGFTPRFDFSVDLFAVGTPGTPLFLEATATDAETDVYRSFGFGGNMLLHDGDGSSPGISVPLGLAEGGGASLGGVDAYDSRPTGTPFFGGVYWSVDAGSLSVPPYTGFSAADIFSGGYAGGPFLFASEAALGLAPGDELDALQVYDRGSLGTFDAGDIVLFSLDPASPSLGLFGVGPGDILMSGSGGFLGPIVPGIALGMGPGDNMNALSVTHIPEPSTFVMIAGLAALVLIRSRQRVS